MTICWSRAFQMRPSTPIRAGTEAARSSSRLAKKITDFQPAIAWRVGAGPAVCRADDRKELKSVRVAGRRRFRNGGHGLAQLRHGVLRVCRGGTQRNTVERRFLSLGRRRVCLRLRPTSALHFGLALIAGVGLRRQGGLVRGYCACDVINYLRRDAALAIKSITADECAMFASTRRRNDFRADGAVMNWGWTADADRLPVRQIPSVPMNLPLLKLFHCLCLYRRLGEKVLSEAVA